MIREIVKDKTFLSLPCFPITIEEKEVIEDLKDTLTHYKDYAIGLGANMIGYRKKAIAVFVDGKVKVMLNPEIVSENGEYEAEEGCLSLKGKRKVKRYKDIEVIYQDEKGREKYGIFHNLEAEAIQHEIDHTKSILI